MQFVYSVCYCVFLPDLQFFTFHNLESFLNSVNWSIVRGVIFDVNYSIELYKAQFSLTPNHIPSTPQNY